jgi:MATE family multidrug resistance protein
MTAFALFSVFIGRAGAVPLAASQITIQLLAFSFMPMWGITIAGSVLTGNWIGAGRPDRAEAYGRQVYKVGVYYVLAVALALVLSRNWIFAVFSVDPAVLAMGASLAVVAALFQICDGMRMVSVGILQGAGDTRYPMLQSLAVLWGIFVPLTYFIVVRSGGSLFEAWLGGTFCYLLQALFLYVRFRSGKWKRIRIFSTPHDTTT